jgi:hypothetical protein
MNLLHLVGFIYDFHILIPIFLRPIYEYITASLRQVCWGLGGLYQVGAWSSGEGDIALIKNDRVFLVLLL